MIKKLDTRQFEKELVKKIAEESDGLNSAKTKEEYIEELADIMAVIEEIKKFKKINNRQLSSALSKNMGKKAVSKNEST